MNEPAPRGLTMGPAPALPDNYLPQITDYHRLAFAVLGEARHAATGRFGLRAAEHGFATPPFGYLSGTQRTVTAVGADLVVVDRTGNETESRRSLPITSLAAMARDMGLAAPGITAREHDSPELGDVNAPLNVSADAGRFLGWWFTLGDQALARVAATPGAHDPEPVQLWPGHFDIATAIGEPDDTGAHGRMTRATYGFSPGDQNHDQPYIYVGPWAGPPDGDDPFWQSEGFSGASLSWADLSASTDPLDAAAGFLCDAFDRLHR